jgi:flavin-dependent dehydrogenase
MTSVTQYADVAIIGAGPSGTVAAALLKQRGYEVVIVERQHFPRFSIGESLLPQCMEFIAEAGMLDAVLEAGFQMKNGAAFTCDNKYSFFEFTDKFTAGPDTTFQVQRAEFDKLLADQATKQGVDIRFGQCVESVEFCKEGASVEVLSEKGEHYTLRSRFLLDASGFGRVLPRLLDLEVPSDFPSRTSLFTHVQDNIVDTTYDREKILITIHPEHQDIWYWLIPFGNGRCSVGVVAENHYFADRSDELVDQLKDFIGQTNDLGVLMEEAEFDAPIQQITGYSSNVKSLWGEHFALLGNAGEFLDPVFSSGVTIAMKSASLAAPLIDQQLQGKLVDWERDYTIPLKRGVNTFRTYVDAWYDGRFQDVIFSSPQQDGHKVRSMISSILAGYAWDIENPYVASPTRRLNTLVELCRI